MKTLAILMQSKKTVFTIPDFKKLFKKENNSYINLLLQPLKKQGILLNIHYGIWVFKDYDVFELASKLRSYSYISFETVLQKSGIIFQNYDHTIFLASDNSIKKRVDYLSIEYHKIRKTILFNPIGIINYNDKYMIASPERAVCDMVYLYGNIVFDNLRPLNPDLLEEI